MTNTNITRIDVPAESSVEFKQVADSIGRGSSLGMFGPCQIYQLLMISATIVSFTYDEMVNAAAKFINRGISLQHKETAKVIRLVCDATHDETSHNFKNTWN